MNFSQTPNTPEGTLVRRRIAQNPNTLEESLVLLITPSKGWSEGNKVTSNLCYLFEGALSPEGINYLIILVCVMVICAM